MQFFATSEKEKRGVKFANQLDKKTKEGTNGIMNVFRVQVKMK
jgi:hypothetical protein